jgi:hypothetical protein
MTKKEKRLAEMRTWSDRKLFFHGVFHGSLLVIGQLMIVVPGIWMFSNLPIIGLPLLTTGIFFVVKDPPWRIAKQIWEMRPSANG